VANDDLAIREGARLRRGALDDPGSDAEVLRFEAGEALPRFYTDSGNALRLADQRDGHLLHSTALGWLVWNGTVWSDDEAGRVVEMAKKTADSIREDVEAVEDAAEVSFWVGYRAKLDAGEKEWSDERIASAVTMARRKAREHVDGFAHSSESASKVKAMVTLAQSDPRMTVKPDELDNIDNALNVQNGVLDLDAGSFVPHSPIFKLTKLANASYDPNAKCPKWEQTIEMFLPDAEVREWVQMAMGFSMLGRHSELMFIGWGSGANGKSTIWDAVRYTLGDYACEAPSDLLTEREISPASESARASLRGKRFVTAIETGRRKNMAEVLMKQLTGESEIPARKMRQDHFTFHNQTAVWLATNHKPVLQGSDDAIWRRIRLIPFTVKLDPDERSSKATVERELHAEADGILLWLMEGLHRYREKGSLSPEPAVVLDATDEYRDEMDSLKEWLRDCCEVGVDEWVPVADLRRSYEQHCKDNGRFPLGARNFNTELRSLGCREASTRLAGLKVKTWKGISLSGTTVEPQWNDNGGSEDD